MTTTNFGRGWRVRPKTSIFADLQGGGSEGEEVRLPHDAQIGLTREPGAGEGAHNAYFPGGAVEYTKTFEVPESWRERTCSLVFEAVHRDAMVYVNGAFAAQRPNGYTTFEVDLDEHLRYGQPNTVRVEARAHQDSRWYTGIGIHRDVHLNVRDVVHLSTGGIRITTPDIDEDRAVVVVEAEVRNAGRTTATVHLDLTLLGDARPVRDTAPVTVRPGQSATARHRLVLPTPRLWSTDDPNLYDLHAALRRGPAPEPALDEVTVAFGVRRLQLDPQQGLRMNGRSVKLRGACIHHDNGPLGAAAIARAEERRIQLLKDAGFNAIRASHNPLSAAMLDACDRVGMLVMDEAFDMWTEAKSPFDYALAFPEWWERDLAAMVLRDRNHPSVIFYSLGNEIPETGSPAGAELGRRMAETVRALDDTRFVTNGINGFVSVLDDVVAGMRARAAASSEHAQDGGVNALMGSAADFMNQVSSSPLVSERTAESFAVLDAAGINYGEARYEVDAEAFPHRVIVGTETFPTRIDRTWALVERLSHVIGDFTWTGWDYLGEVGIGRQQYTDESPQFAAPQPWVTAWCGDLDITGVRRPASYYRETVYGLRTAPYLAVQRPEVHGRTPRPAQWSWTDSISSWSWDVNPGTPVTVEVYSEAEEVELHLDGQPVGRAPAGREHAFRAAFDVAFAPGELTAVALEGGQEVARTSLRSADPDLQVRVGADRDVLRDDDGDLAFVTIELTDADGVVNTSAERAVEVEVKGPAVLQALASARPDNAEPYTASRHTTFDGRLLAVVRPEAPGSVRVIVRADGLPEQAVVLTVEPATPGDPGEAS